VGEIMAPFIINYSNKLLTAPSWTSQVGESMLIITWMNESKQTWLLFYAVQAVQNDCSWWHTNQTFAIQLRSVAELNKGRNCGRNELN
jgi:hypothetical protein